MPETSIILKYIKQIKKSVFTTRQLADISGKSVSNVTQSLNFLARNSVISKLYRGVWAENTGKPVNPLEIIQYVLKSNRAYVSFLSALHIHGVIEQIPQVITLASTMHTKKIKTSAGVFMIHKISPKYFFGFNWNKDSGKYLIAEPEKALADCLYLYTRKKNQYGYFPELNFPKTFSIKKVRSFVDKIPDIRARLKAKEKLNQVVIK